MALHQAAAVWDYEDGAEPGDLMVLGEHPRLARGTRGKPRLRHALAASYPRSWPR